jgi:hypothetical protein
MKIIFYLEYHAKFKKQALIFGSEDKWCANMDARSRQIPGNWFPSFDDVNEKVIFYDNFIRLQPSVSNGQLIHKLSEGDTLYAV